MNGSLSIIIPCYADAQALKECLARLRPGLFSGDEIIVADSSPHEACAAVAGGTRYLPCGTAGRGPQMNAGAALASGSVLVFNHADTHLLPAHLESIREWSRHSSVPAGAFYKDTASHYPAWVWADGLIRWWMQRFGVVYGDQSLFIRADAFRAMGGYAAIPLMEDVELSARLRRSGGVRLLGPPLRTSMRAFRKKGLLLTRCRNVLFVCLFRAGVSAERLYQWYYGRPSNPAQKLPGP